MAKLCDDTLKYMREHNVSTLMEHILRRMVLDLPENPVEYIHTLTQRSIPPQIIISGPPGSGKGTQCQALVREFNVVHISSGDLLRTAVQEGTDVGKMAESFMVNGDLVPDKLIIGIIRDRLEQADVQERGWLLDGFPRTKAQAEALEASGIVPHIFLLLEVHDETVVERIALRRTDPATGMVYHLKYNPPPAYDVVLRDRLVQRSDDHHETVIARLKVYHSNLSGLERQYRSVMLKVNAEEELHQVEKNVVEAVRPRLIH